VPSLLSPPRPGQGLGPTEQDYDERASASSLRARPTYPAALRTDVGLIVAASGRFRLARWIEPTSIMDRKLVTY
jgi:hypothetical protein